MKSFSWGKAYETGIKVVDDQHHNLVELINEFGDKLVENRIDGDLLEEVLAKLASYAQQHFDDEEGLMVEAGIDPRHVNQHIAEHRDFFENVALMRQQMGRGGRTAERDLLDFLTHWLAYHILGSDQNMSAQIAAVAAGSTPEEAYEARERGKDAATEPLLFAVNALFELVSRRNRELHQLTLSLEEKVLQRTQELQEANENLDVLASTDFLTELPNRRQALLRLRRLWEDSGTAGKPIACLMIDADGFKAINDSHGHDAGDIVLKELARELRHAVRTDDLVCRLGGDEFLVICPATDLEGALLLGEQTRCKIAALRVQAGDGVWRGSISIGVAVSTTDTATVDALLKNADEGVYQAKRAGRNCVRTIHRKLTGSGLPAQI